MRRNIMLGKGMDLNMQNSDKSVMNQLESHDKAAKGVQSSEAETGPEWLSKGNLFSDMGSKTEQ